MDLLRFARRWLRETLVLLIVTFREDDLATDDQLRVVLGELARHRTTRRIALAPLSADAVRALADGSDLEAAALYRLTGGNPFYEPRSCGPGWRRCRPRPGTPCWPGRPARAPTPGSCSRSPR